MTDRIDPHRAVNEIIRMAPLFAKAKAERIYVEEFRKTIKAQLMKSCGESAVTAQEREAYAHPDYVKHLDAIKEAVAEEENLRWLLVAAQARVEVWRSQESTARAEGRAAT